LDTRAKVKRFVEGHRAAAERQRELREKEGPQPEQAIAEALDALAALEQLGLWPGPRDPHNEREVERLRERWAKLKREFRNVERATR
jgi:hypothetical protein